MRLTVLTDNNTFLLGRFYHAEPALSYYIEDDEKKILFDVGYSNAFIENAKMMGIDLLDLDYIVLSHGHIDHTGGLKSLIDLYTEAMDGDIPYRKPTIVAHPLVFSTRMVGDTNIGSSVSEIELVKYFELELSDKPIELTNKMMYLGEIPRENDFESREPLGKVVTEDGIEDDFILDDTAMVYKSNEGLVIITGCSHSGICNITEYARNISDERKVIDIFGGFHLLNPDSEQLKRTLDYLEELYPDSLHACHCTDLYSKNELAKIGNLQEVGVGVTVEYE